jgi:hypothetical protein
VSDACAPAVSGWRDRQTFNDEVAMKIIFPLMLGAGLVMPVAEAVPTFKIEQSCKAATTIDQQEKLAVAQSYNACIRDENEARQELVKGWASFPPAIRTRCIQEASIGGIDSYVDALTCMQIQTSVAKENVTKLKGASKKNK